MKHMGMTKAELGNALIDVTQRLYTRGLNTTLSGNVSARLMGSRILITPSGVDKARLTPGQLSHMDVNSDRQASLDGGPTPTSEFRVHTHIYRGMPAVNAVVHAHPEYSLAMIRAMGRARFVNALAQLEEEYEYYVGRLVSQPWMPEGSIEIAEAVAARVKAGASVVVMEDHGTVGIGRSLAEALGRIEAVEAMSHRLFIAEMLRKMV